VTSTAPPFRRDRLLHGLIAVSAFSRAGDTVWAVAIAWTAVRLASPAVAGLVVAAGTVPRALVLLYGGVVADRIDALRLMRLTNLARTLVLAVTALLAWTQHLSLGVLVAVVVLFGVTDALYNPAQSTVPRQLLRTADLTAYYGANQTAARLGGMAGAVVGGVLVATWGIGAPASVDAGTFVLEGTFLLLVRPRYALRRAVPESALRSVAAGFVHLWHTPVTRTVVLTLSGLNLAVAPALDLGVALRAVNAGWGAHTVGYSEALVGLGATLGALGVIVVRPRRSGRWGFGLLLVQGLAIVALGLGTRVVLFGGCVLIGVTAGAASALLGAVFSSVVDEAYLGRMASVQALGDDIFMPAATALFGALAGAALSLPFVLFGGVMAAAMALVLRNPVIRGLAPALDAPRPDPVAEA